MSGSQHVLRSDVPETEGCNADNGVRQGGQDTGSQMALDPQARRREVWGSCAPADVTGQPRELGWADVIDCDLKTKRRVESARRGAQDFIHRTRAEDAERFPQAARLGRLGQYERAPLPGMVSRLVLQVFQELVPIGKSAHRLDAAERVLQLDLGHDHGCKIGERRLFFRRDLPRLGAEHAHGSKAEPVSGHQRRARIKPIPDCASKLSR